MTHTPSRRSSDTVAVALLSAAGLVLEVALTRLYATLFYPPTVFAVLSLAILGIGLGAAAATLRPAWQARERTSLYLALAAASALLMPLAAALLPPSWRLALYLPLPLPYFFMGLALVAIFAAAPARSPRLYLADLLGAGVGALFAVPLLNVAGGFNAIPLAAALFALAAAVLVAGASTAPLRARLSLPLAVLLLSLLFGAGNLALGVLDVDMAALPADKPIVESLQPRGDIVHTEWDAFARTDLVDPGDGGPYRLYADGAAGSVMPPATDNDFLWRDIGFFPFATEQPQRVFVIGPGGGLDVWFGLQSGAEEIVAVEVNQASVDIVRRFGNYNGHLYEQPPVRLLHDEGRSVLRREGRDYDLVFLSQVVTLAAERGGYTLVEESAYTVEAFADYLTHLRPGGQLALKLYDEPTLTRALSTALAVLQRPETGPRAESDAEALQHTMAFLDPRSDPPIPLLLVRNEPYTEEDSLALGAVAQRIGLAPLYLPHVLAQPPLDAVQAGELPFSEIVAQSESDISPTSDDRPFFYQFERGLPSTLRPLLLGLGAVILLGVVALVWVRRRGAPAAGLWSPLYFAMLGLGFMTLEVAIIQQVRLFLGHPTWAVTTVLATLLIGGGLGSGLAGRLWPAPASSGKRAPVALPPWPAVAVALLTLAWLLLWPALSNNLLGAARPWRVTVAVLSLLPLALAMGMPFPLGLRAVGGRSPGYAGRRDVALAWAVNGVMTVAGSALAIAVAILAGFSRVLLLGLAAYVVAAVVAGIGDRRLEIRDRRFGIGELAADKRPGTGQDEGG
ncbi:MAG TPA: hypothetical protein VK879_02930 [Candidatus Sulfomarinibacteraceae bacterium]|nr:hypothetical protein [Candidatus Sulfomarinibacteraceae bacterium]